MICHKVGLHSVLIFHPPQDIMPQMTCGVDFLNHPSEDPPVYRTSVFLAGLQERGQTNMGISTGVNGLRSLL